MNDQTVIVMKLTSNFFATIISIFGYTPHLVKIICILVERQEIILVKTIYKDKIFL